MNKLLFVPLLAILVAAPAWAGDSRRWTAELAPAPQSDAFRDLIVGAIFGAVDAASADRYMAIADSTARERDVRSQNQRSAGLGYGMKF